ncbi:hypothetical protein Tco_1401433 [Tanacetum coccineum]
MAQYQFLSLQWEPPKSLPYSCNVLLILVHLSLHPCPLANQLGTDGESFVAGTARSVLTAVHFGTDGESFVAGTVGSVTVVSLYGPSKMHFLKASPFGFVSVYLKKRDCHYAYLPVVSIGG